MKEIKGLIKSMERVDKAMEDTCVKKYLELARLFKELKDLCKKQQIKISDALQQTNLPTSKLQRSIRIADVYQYLTSKNYKIPSYLAIVHYEDIFRIRNRYKDVPNEEKEIIIQSYLNDVKKKKQTDLHKEYLPSDTDQWKTHINEYISYLKSQFSKSSKSITLHADHYIIANKLYPIIYSHVREYQKLQKSIVQFITSLYCLDLVKSRRS